MTTLNEIHIFVQYLNSRLVAEECHEQMIPEFVEDTAEQLRTSGKVGPDFDAREAMRLVRAS
jgi:hypothetical protein